MKILKKILSLLIPILFIFLSFSFVQADIHSTKISLQVIPSFEFSFPQSTVIEFKANNTFLGNLYVENFNLPEGYALLVNIENTPFINNYNSSYQIPYTCNYKNVIIKSSQDIYPLNIIIDPIYWDISLPGDYTSTITFTLTIIKL